MTPIPADQFQFCGPTYLAESPTIDGQRCINLYPSPGIGSSKTRFSLIGRPGMSAPGVTALGAGFGHSIWPGAGRLFVSTGTNVYEVDHAGSIITDYGTGISNFGPTPTPMIANGTQLLVCDQVAGKIFNCNAAGPSLDLVFNGVALEYLDGFYFAIATGASLVGANPNQINRSASGDGTNWAPFVGTASFVIETGAADLITQLAALNGLLYIFGQKTIRVWYDAGSANFPLARVNGGIINLGCLAPNSVVKFSNSILWLGSDSTGYGQIYMLQGLNPVRVSNTAIEQMIATLTYSPKLTSARAFGYQEAGHTFYVLNLITSGIAGLKSGMTLVYDLTTGLWHERTYAGGASALVPAGYANVPGFSGVAPSYVIDELIGQIWYQTILLPNDNGTPITYTRIAPHINAQRKWLKYPRFELDMDQGNGSIAPVLDYSNGKVTSGSLVFNGYNYAMAQAADQGTANTAQQFYKTQLGRSRDRTFKVTITESTNLIRIANATAYVEAA